MSTNGTSVKEARGGEWEDKGIERMWMLGEQWLSIFFCLQTCKHLWKEVEEHCAEKLLIILWLFIAVFVTLLCLSHKRLTEPHRPMNHRLKATALEMGLLKKNSSCKEKKEGDLEETLIVRKEGLNCVTSVICICKLAISAFKSMHTLTL